MSKLTLEASNLLRRMAELHIDEHQPDTRGRRLLVKHGLIESRPSRAGHRKRFGLTQAGRDCLERDKAKS